MRRCALVEVGGKRLVGALVSKGLAHTKGVFQDLSTGEKATAYAEKLGRLEREARQKRLGVWASSAAKITETP